MMRYLLRGAPRRYVASQPRWFEADNNGTSTTPDEVDFYGYENDNELYKAVYNVTKDIFNGALDLPFVPNWAPIIDDNNGTHSDRHPLKRSAFLRVRCCATLHPPQGRNPRQGEPVPGQQRPHGGLAPGHARQHHRAQPDQQL